MSVPGRPALTSGPPTGWGCHTQTEAHCEPPQQASETRKVVSHVQTLQDRPSGSPGKAKHTITIEHAEPGRPDAGLVIVERYGVGFKRTCARDTELHVGTSIEDAARRIAEAFEAEFVDVTPAPAYSKPRELPVDVVDVGDQVAVIDEDGATTSWVTVAWVDDCHGEFCTHIAGVCSGVLGLADGTERHYDVVDRPTVRIPCEVTA